MHIIQKKQAFKAKCVNHKSSNKNSKYPSFCINNTTSVINVLGQFKSK